VPKQSLGHKCVPQRELGNEDEGHMEAPAMEDLVAKVKAIAASPQGELFVKIVENFFEHLETESFSEEDLADIEEGLEDIRQGRCLTLEEYRQGKRL
jgi:hypothetical protein